MVKPRRNLRHQMLATMVMGVILVASTSHHACAADSSPLGVRQQRVKRMMQELDRKFQDLAQKLQKTEPEQAQLLVKAFQQSQERLIESRMNEISDLLDAAKLSDADTKQNEVLLELDDLLRVLLDQSKNWDKVNAEIERLEAMRKAVQNLLEKQRDHLHETDRLANKDKTMADLDEQIQAIETLIEKQTDLEKQTVATKPTEKETFEELADKQAELQQQTEQLAKSIGKPEPSDKAPANPSEDAESQDQPANQNDSKPSDANKPGQGGGKPGEIGSQQCKACLGNAAQSQQSAAQKLAKSLPKEAQQDEQKAIDDLKKAVDALKEERDRIARLPDEMLDQLAEKQDETTQDAQQLLDEMQESPESKTRSGPKGQKNVQQAKQSMKQAADGLRESDPESAAKEQEKAVEELKKALDEIEQRLAQLREDTLIDRLARLEARFRGMLARQQKATASTASIHAQVTEGESISRADRLKLRKLASEERDLAEAAYQTIDILIEDGTSVVFPRVVTNMQADLERLSDLLTDNQTGEFTQSLQQEVEITLQELIDALQRNLKKKKGGGGGQCDCEPPLLPGSAELKLLRSMQLRVNRRTVTFDKLHAEREMDETLQKEVTTLTELQQEVAEMTLDLAEKF